MKAVVARLIAEAGQPVSAATLSLDEARHAAADGRMLSTGWWSTMGDREAWFAVTDTVELSRDGRPVGIVFPRPIPEDLRGGSYLDWDWELPDDIYRAFGL